MFEGPAPGRESVIAIDEQDRENVVADGLKTSHADKGNRRGNKSVFLGAFPNEINSLGRRFVSHQPPQVTPTASHRKMRGRSLWGRGRPVVARELAWQLAGMGRRVARASRVFCVNPAG